MFEGFGNSVIGQSTEEGGCPGGGWYRDVYARAYNEQYPASDHPDCNPSCWRILRVGLAVQIRGNPDKFSELPIRSAMRGSQIVAKLMHKPPPGWSCWKEVKMLRCSREFATVQGEGEDLDDRFPGTSRIFQGVDIKGAGAGDAKGKRTQS